MQSSVGPGVVSPRYLGHLQHAAVREPAGRCRAALHLVVIFPI
jgi:hypothetical protein